MKITIILGSIRKGRQSHKLAHYLKKKLDSETNESSIIDLKETPFAIFDGFAKDSYIETISKQLSESDCFLIVSPEYQGSYSGVLKNFLDYYFFEFHKKPTAVATASSGKMGGINASVQLQHVILSMKAFPLPQKLIVPFINDAINDEYEASQDSLENETNSFLEQFIWFANAICRHNKIIIAEKD